MQSVNSIPKSKIAFFDFCETIVDFQTADAFVDFVRERTGNSRMVWMNRCHTVLSKVKIIKIAEKLTGYRHSINKQLKLLQLRGFEYTLLDNLAKEYYQKRLKPHFIDQLLSELLNKKEQGYEIVLVSGGYSIYLKYFAEEYCVNKVISSSIGFKRNICTGKFGSIDCLNENKVILLESIYDRQNLECIAYSDSITDLPLLTWVDEGYVVSRGRSQKWSYENKLNEIVWTRKK